MTTKFKTLVYGGKEDHFYVKIYDLHEDIRPTPFPITYPVKFELDDIKAAIIRVYNTRGFNSFNMDKINRNIDKCKLITVEIISHFDNN